MKSRTRHFLFHPSSFILHPFLLLAIIVPALADAPAGRPSPATLPVRTTQWLSLHDRVRNRDLGMSVCYPDDQAKHPLVVFSHGAYGSALNTLPLVQFWASHGYIVIAPTHADSLMYLKRDENNDPWSGPHDFGVFGRPTTQGTWKPIWGERPRDLRFVLDSLDEIEKRIPALAGRIDRQHIAVAGHSLGAYSTMLLCGAVVDTPQERGFTLSDSRANCAILISPQGRGQQGLRDGSWDGMRLPALIITGSYDVSVNEQPPTWREEPYKLSPAGDKYLLFIEGANHNSYLGQHVEKKSDGMPLQRKGENDDKLGEAIFDDTKAVTLDFLDAYLKSDGSAKKRLRDNEIGSTSAGRSTISSR